MSVLIRPDKFLKVGFFAKHAQHARHGGFTLNFKISTQSVLTGIILYGFEKDGGVAMTVSLSDIENAFLYVSEGPQYQYSALLDIDSGKIFYTSEPGDSDELQEDAYGSDK